MKDTEKTFIVTDSCMWEANRVSGTLSEHTIEVVDAETGKIRLIRSGSKIRFVEGFITKESDQDTYNEQQDEFEKEKENKLNKFKQYVRDWANDLWKSYRKI